MFGFKTAYQYVAPVVVFSLSWKPVFQRRSMRIIRIDHIPESNEIQAVVIPAHIPAVYSSDG